MNISVKVETPQAGSSSFTAIASKSMAHRFLLANALTRLCGGEGAELLISTTSRDIEATRDCVSELLAPEIEGRRARFLCQESGSTFRFLLPIVGALGRRGCFVLEGRLKDRPLSPLYEEMTAHGCILSPQGTPQFLLDGRMTGGIYTIAGDVSSQYITGLLFALPLAREDSEIHIIGKLESRDYVEMTLAVLKRAGRLRFCRAGRPEVCALRADPRGGRLVEVRRFPRSRRPDEGRRDLHESGHGQRAGG